MDSLKCQTATASPAEPGGLSCLASLHEQPALGLLRGVPRSPASCRAGIRPRLAVRRVDPALGSATTCYPRCHRQFIAEPARSFLAPSRLILRLLARTPERTAGTRNLPRENETD
jgi:hypothetical protein